MSDKQQENSYEAAGVSIDRGNEFVSRIKPLAETTRRPEVLAGLGGFGSLFDLSGANYRQPVLVAGADGVGTKLKLAARLGRHEEVGTDLVAMCVNDVLAQGAEPLFFLDYFASSRLETETAHAVVKGIAHGCRQAGCALVGGETAELPGMYQNNEYDLAGFCVGIVEKDELVTGCQIEQGDVLLALPASGPHANGFSLIRKILADTGASLTDKLDNQTLADLLLQPTRIYKDILFTLLPDIRPKGIAHITGGGLTGNLPRIMPAGLRTEVDRDSWRWPSIFHWLMQAGKVSTEEMYRTFNCGVGMVLALDEAAAAQALRRLREVGEPVWRIGTVHAARARNTHTARSAS